LENVEQPSIAVAAAAITMNVHARPHAKCDTAYCGAENRAGNGEMYRSRAMTSFIGQASRPNGRRGGKSQENPQKAIKSENAGQYDSGWESWSNLLGSFLEHVACGRRPGVVMPAEYSNFGVRFLYPENWLVADEQLSEWPRSVSIESPGGGFWQIQVYSYQLDPADISSQVLQAMQKEYDDLEYESVDQRLGHHLSVGYDFAFFCLDFLVISRVRCFCIGEKTYVLTCQAESSEFERQELVFEAITSSMLQRQKDHTETGIS
jgi:hypothetical protein